MRICLTLLSVFVCFFGVAAAQDQTCEDFEVDEPACLSPCSGSPLIANMIVGDNGSGFNHIEYEIFTCSNPNKQNSCNQTTQIAVSVVNPSCNQGGGGGDCEVGCASCLNGDSPAGAKYFCDYSTCSCVFGSPIIVDTTVHGFHLTSASGGVFFDIAGNGRPVRLAWTDADSGNAFLALDRNHNGTIDSGKELFGNFTQQPESSHPNGFAALAVFDEPENGGNGDGVIDSRDAVYSKLLLWIDENHDGISQSRELHSLPELGVFSIALNYREKPFTDQFGNWFHYRAALNPDPLDGESRDGRWTYDVFFEIDKGQNASKTRVSSVEKIIATKERSLN